ncbi:MAG: 2OG-Fe(II) oxygenase [Sedimenticola sp.]
MITSNIISHPDSMLDKRIEERIISGLATDGWCVIPDFVTADFIERLRNDAIRLWDQGTFRKAGVGQGEVFEIRDDLRSDRIMWLDPVNSTGSLRSYLELTNALRQAINKALFLGLFEYEGHIAIYPPGSRYGKHLDCFQGDESRTVTAILYLNDQWAESDGGQLKIYMGSSGSEQAYQEIYPHAGQLVIFLSSRFVHEVMPTHRARLSITGWFKRRGVSGL